MIQNLNPITETQEEVYDRSKKTKILKKTMSMRSQQQQWSFPTKIKRKRVDFVDSSIKFLRKNCQVQRAARPVFIVKIIYRKIKTIQKFMRISNQSDFWWTMMSTMNKFYNKIISTSRCLLRNAELPVIYRLSVPLPRY